MDSVARGIDALEATRANSTFLRTRDEKEDKCDMRERERRLTFSNCYGGLLPKHKDAVFFLASLHLTAAISRSPTHRHGQRLRGQTHPCSLALTS
jgi:hypothetical protein